MIESLPDGELRSGTELFETTLAPVSIKDPGFVTELRRPVSKRDFLAHLAEVVQVTRQFGRSPILHLETHGGRDGLLLKGGERILWGELVPQLAEINRLSRMNLIVVAAMCHGWHLSDILRPTDRAPAFGILGTMSELAAGDLLDAMKAFYARLSSPSRDLGVALRETNETLPAENGFDLVTAERLFCRIFDAYVELVRTEETESERVNRIVAEIARVRNLDLVQTMQLRQNVTSDLRDNEAIFGHYRVQFLMLDLFPENDRRFNLTYSDCVRSAS